eukprot:scaffold333723_cov40-Prasinocladus_malaysianus.AAC.1
MSIGEGGTQDTNGFHQTCCDTKTGAVAPLSSNGCVTLLDTHVTRKAPCSYHGTVRVVTGRLLVLVPYQFLGRPTQPCPGPKSKLQAKV